MHFVLAPLFLQVLTHLSKNVILGVMQAMNPYLSIYPTFHSPLTIYFDMRAEMPVVVPSVHQLASWKRLSAAELE